MLIIWLLVWLGNHTPNVSFNPFNSWAIGLIVCGFLDFMDGDFFRRRRRRRRADDDFDDDDY